MQLDVTHVMTEPGFVPPLGASTAGSMTPSTKTVNVSTTQFCINQVKLQPMFDKILPPTKHVSVIVRINCKCNSVHIELKCK